MFTTQHNTKETQCHLTRTNDKLGMKRIHICWITLRICSSVWHKKHKTIWLERNRLVKLNWNWICYRLSSEWLVKIRMCFVWRDSTRGKVGNVAGGSTVSPLENHLSFFFYSIADAWTLGNTRWSEAVWGHASIPSGVARSPPASAWIRRMIMRVSIWRYELNFYSH